MGFDDLTLTYFRNKTRYVIRTKIKKLNDKNVKHVSHFDFEVICKNLVKPRT